MWCCSAPTIAIAATAADAIGVAGVQFKRDGANLGAEDTIAPYSVNWNTTGVANGSYTITAVARDAAGNSASSSGVTITVANVTADTIAPAVSVTAPINGATVSNTVTVSAKVADPQKRAED